MSGSGLHEHVLAALTASGVAFEPTPFHGDLRTVAQVADALGLDPARIAKALLVRVDGTTLAVVVLPGNRRLDTEAVATALGAARVEMVGRAEVQSLSGVEPGAVTPLLALVRPELRVLADEALVHFKAVNVSSGSPLLGVTIAPRTLLELTHAATLKLSSAEATH
ncbi:MAG TPA: YbaK/EbsC family protein [Conexibacter sp.]|nr:YbaK/EbsC family protein [Conexibacter sp.]